MSLDEGIARDPFVRQFFERVPLEVRGSFSAAQLAALKMVFGAATRTGHTVDVRFSLPTVVSRRRLYLVFVAGRDRRGTRTRRRGIAGRLLAFLGRLAVRVGLSIVVLLFLLAILNFVL